MTEHSDQIEYLVISGYEMPEVKRKIEQAALHGFKLQGGIAVTDRASSGPWYAQAMVRNRGT